MKCCISASILLLVSAATPVFADSPLAVLDSNCNRAAYSEQHIGEFEEDWKHFKHAFETANVRYDQLKDTDITNGGAEKLKAFKVIVLPLLVDLPKESVRILTDYVKQGGKLIATDSCGTPSQSASEIIALAGVKLVGHRISQDACKLVWPRRPFPLEQVFSVGTLSANLVPLSPQNNTAHWTAANLAEQGTAISCDKGNYFIGWAPGMQGEIASNAQIISLVLEEASPGITQQAAVQISFADYQKIKEEMQYLDRRTEEVIQTAKQADLVVPFSAIQENYDSGLAHEIRFEKAYQDRQFLEANRELQKARNDMSLAFAKAMPVRLVQQRGVWLDRGTIVANQSPELMRRLLDKLKESGINTIYFETNNAGYAMFPSMVAPQNPQLKDDFDIFGLTLEEAHKRGMEFHAWLWVFNVGNQWHNLIIGKPIDFPGPVLSKNGLTWALAGRNGSLLAYNQHEYWLDPALAAPRQYVKDLAVEVAGKYAIDGLQYDYVRYPFDMAPNEMGWDQMGRRRFECETGLSLDNLNNETRHAWQDWRTSQVSSFVEETSAVLRKLRPGMRIGAAVYGFPRRLRCSNIQQDWETWVQNGSVDAVNPMTYKEDNSEFQQIANNCREYSEDKALVFPGISVRQLDTAGLIEQLDTARTLGTLGTTLFAVAQLDEQKLNLLKVGPYRRQTILTPQADPIRATTLLVDDFAATVNLYIRDPRKCVMSDIASTNEVSQGIAKLQQEAHALKSEATPEEISRLRKLTLHLHSLATNWLRIDAFVQRGFRAQYILSYLSEIESILKYAEHKAETQEHSVAQKEPFVNFSSRLH